MAENPAEAQPRLHLGRLLLRALVLPFSHPRLAVICGLVPFILLMCSAVLFIGASVIGGDPHKRGLGLGFPIDDRIGGRTEVMHWLGTLPGFPIFHWTLWFLSLALLGFWFCAWQRGVVTDFAEAARPWLRRSLARTPHYLVALAAWLFLPLGLAEALTRIATWVVFDWAALDRHKVADGNGAWPLVGVLIGFVAIPPIWLFARLSLLPPMVATRNWAEALRDAWKLGRARNRILFFCFLVCLGAGQAVAIAVAAPVFQIARMFIEKPVTDPDGSLLPTVAYLAKLGQVIFASYDAVTLLILLWCASFAALVARDIAFAGRTNAADAAASGST